MLRNVISSKQIRSHFFQHFLQNSDHKLVKSIPIKNFFDHSPPLITHGAQRFKNIILGDEPPEENVVAYQRCTRYASTLSCGVYPFQHTVFEMLGNHSFGSYDKKEACKLAWDLLTSPPFSISSERLFVSYFKNEEVDDINSKEICDIWSELGVLPDHIVPTNTNVWSINDSNGVEICGTSTKLYVSLDGSRVCEDITQLIELWSLRFFECNKIVKDTSNPNLDFILTGMSLERLAAILQNESSSYHIDLIRPLFDIIRDSTGAPEYKGSFTCDMDLAYRRVSELTRLLTFSIADYALPQFNSKIRKALHDVLGIARIYFKQSHKLIIELSNNLAELYQDIHPEISNNLKLVHSAIEQEDVNIIVSYEKETSFWTSALKQYPELESIPEYEYPYICSTFREIMKILDRKRGLTMEEVYYFHEKLNIERFVLDRLTNALKSSIRWKEYEMYKMSPKIINPISKLEEIVLQSKIKTDDSFKHMYERNSKTGEYTFPKLEARLCAVLDISNILVASDNNNLPDEMKSIVNAEVDVNESDMLGLVFDKTNFSAFHSNDDDYGIIEFENGLIFNVLKIRKCKQFVTHFVVLFKKSNEKTILEVGENAVLKVNSKRRYEIMEQNTLAHLFNGVVKKIFPPTITEHNLMKENYFTCKIYFLKNKNEAARIIQDEIEKLIKLKLEVKTDIIMSECDLMNYKNIVLHPIYTYPRQNLRVVSFENSDIGPELCDAVYFQNSSDVGDFYVTYHQQKNLFYAVAGKESLYKAFKLQEIIENYNQELEDELNALNRNLLNINQMLDFAQKLTPVLMVLDEYYQKTPYLFTMHSVTYFDLFTFAKSELQKIINQLTKVELIDYVKYKVNNKYIKQMNFAVNFITLECNLLISDSVLIEAIYANKFPSLTFYIHKKNVKAVCHVPQECTTEKFNAVIWLGKFVEQVGDPRWKIKQEEQMDIYCFMCAKTKKENEMIPYGELFLKLSKSIAEELYC